MRQRQGITGAQRGAQLHAASVTHRRYKLLVARLRLLYSSSITQGGKQWVLDYARSSGVSLDG